MGATIDIGTRNFSFDPDVTLTTTGTVTSGKPLSNIVDGKKRTYAGISTTFRVDFDLQVARKIDRVYIKSNATLTSLVIKSADDAAFTVNVTTHTQNPVTISTGLYRYVTIDAQTRRYWRIETTTLQSGTEWQVYEVFLFEFKSKMDATTSEDDLPSNVEFHPTEPVSPGYYLANGAFVQPRIEVKYAPVINFHLIQQSFYDTLFSYFDLGGSSNMDGELTLFMLQDYYRERILQCVIPADGFNLEIDQQGIHTDPPRYSGSVLFRQSK